MAEIALAHFIGTDVERVYQRSDILDRRREMMTAEPPENGGSTLAGNTG